MWPTAGARSLVVGRHEGSNVTVAFAKDGHLLSTSDLGVVKRWPLDPADHTGAGELWRQPGAAIGGTLELDPAGRFALVEVHVGATALVVPLDGSPVQVRGLTHLDGKFINCWSGRLDPQGRRLATYVFTLKAGDLRGIRVLDLDTGAERTLDTRPAPGDGCEKEGTMQLGAAVPVWLADGRLLSDGDGGIRAWDPAAGTSTLLRPCRGLALADVVIPTPDSRSLVRLTVASVTALASKLVVVDLVSGGVREITSHGARVSSVALDRSGGVLLTGDADGVVRVGPLSGEEPHLLYGHTGPVTGVAVSPDGRRIASGSEDGTIRLWDMPDLATPPLHTLPHDELLAKLRSYTNLRAVRDPVSDTGWKIEVGPFPGWAVVPEWWP
jgi:WD40 repeat protein